MIVVGDVAIAAGDCFEFVDFPETFVKKPLCLNLEGAVVRRGFEPSWGVYNTQEWLQSLAKFNLGPMFAANNHILDVVDGIDATHGFLSERGMQLFGAGECASAAARAVTVRAAGCNYVLLGFGWPVIGCVAARRSRRGVNELKGARVRAQVSSAVNDAKDARVLVIIHANYEFELYPQPAHRRLARQLIDMGAYAVVFHHPHIVGPVERYRGRTIAYSVGNWAFSYGRFFGGRLRFPSRSFHQIALEFGAHEDIVHHARFVPPHTVQYERCESVSSPGFSLRPSFEGFDADEYDVWFRRYRIKRKLLPVYRDPDANLGNALRDGWVGLRQRLIDGSARIGLKPMRRC